MKGLIIYKTKYGSTKKYAGWLSEETGFPCVSTDEADIKSLPSYDVLIFCGGVYASGISCVSFLKKVYDKIRDKKIMIFACAASPYDERFIEALAEHNLKDGLKDIPVFYGRGGFDMKGMTFADRTLCRMLRKAVAKKDPKDYELWESALMSVSEDEKGDWTDKAYLEPLLKSL